jgi:hypothetical protein
LIELVVLVIGAMWLFMMIIAGVLSAFEFISDAFSPAFDDYERAGSNPGNRDD